MPSSRPAAPSLPATFLVVLLLSLPAGAGAQTCPEEAGVHATEGWAAYRADDLAAAADRFREALRLCPGQPYATTGLGYVLLRRGEDAEARARFRDVAAVEPGNVDALVGLGILAWRAGELEEVAARFGAVVELDPDHPTALDYLARLPEGLGPPPERPPLVLPDTLVYPARAAGDRFEVRGPDGWRPFFWKGINLGAALPGRNPSEFPDSATYARWIREMADMNANVVRVYTIHPPHFYEALRAWNLAHPDRALWLVHGVWTELPEDDDYAAAEFEEPFFREMRRVVDLVHGRADVPPRPGHASGFYTADVSPWTLAWIVGREWEPFSALAFDSIRGGESGFQGRYLTVAGGNAMEAWLGRAMEEMVAYEAETYRAQRPVAYTNWPTLDPLPHPSETTVDEEMAIRRARGERPTVRPREYDNDALSLDATRVRPTGALPAGTFASFHAYPYYPDFMVLGERYADAASSLGPSRYFGYLRELKAHHPDQPVVISEYGVPASLGVAHLQPQGWHHGGLTEEEMARIDRRLTLEIAEAGLAGGALFAWMDEWFKKNWVALEFELPPDRNRLWYNRLDAEQHYGMRAMDARPPVPGATLDARLPAWRARPPVARGEGGLVLRAAADAAYLWLLVDAPGRAPGDTLFVGFDVLDPDAGDVRWPGAVGPRLPVGVEFVLRDDGDAVRVLADPPSNPFRQVEVGRGATGLEGRRLPVDNPPAGLFHARVEQRFNLPYYTEPGEDGRYDTLRVVVNRRRFSRDSTEHLAVGYDRGLLPGGPAPDGFWQRAEEGRVLEVRIPWLLVNVTDPSSRSVLSGPGEDNVGRAAGRAPGGRWQLEPSGAWPDSVFGAFETTEVEDVGLVVGLRGAGEGSDALAHGRFSWETWEEPAWESRLRPVYRVMARTFAELDPFGTGTVAPEPDAARAASQEDPADAAWRAGELERARTLYQARLAANPEDGAALHRLALMRAWEEDYEGSLELFDRLLEAQPDNVSARVDRARVLAWRGDLDAALDALDRVLEEDPGDVTALEAQALFEAWAGRYDASLSTYDQLLAIAPGRAGARRSQAQVLSWAERFDESRAVFDSLLAADPDDLDARLGLARVLSFADRLDEAEREYRTVLDADPENLDALRGLGRVRSWRGELVAGEASYRRALAVDPADVGALTGLAQTLRWQGRNAAALEVLEEARRLDPADSDVREQLRWVHAALGERVRPSLALEWDSDDNRMVTTAASAQWHPLPRLGLRADVYRRGLSQNALERSAWGGSVGASVQLEPGWTLGAGAGRSRTDGTGASSFASWRLSAASPGRYPVRATAVLSSEALDATARLAQVGVRIRELSLTGLWTPAPAWRLDGALGRATLEGTEENRRTSAALSASRRVGRAWTFGVGGRTFSYDEDLTDGYFDPDFYGIAEATARWLGERGSWSLLVEAAPGLQRIGEAGEASATLRGSGRVAWQAGPGRELSLSAGYSTTGLQSFSTGSSDYRYTALVLAASWVF